MSARLPDPANLGGNVTIQITRPFFAYIAVEELPKIADRRDFIFHLPFEIEGTNRTERAQWPWSYSGTQEAIDQKADVDGLIARSELELKAFRRHLEQELATKGQRLYADGDRPRLIRGSVKTAAS
jgi:hypothetical protein